MEQGAHTTIVSPTRNSSADAQLLPPPNLFVSLLLRLPFKTGQVWRVGQGWASGGSHSGKSAFALDLSLVAGESENKLPNPNAPGDPACGEPVLAAAAGELVYAYDGGGYLDPNDPPDANGVNDDYDAKNNLRVELAPFAYATYMHTFTGSISAAFPYVELPPWGLPLAVQLGKQLGTVGTRNGCHLHFSIANSTGDLDLDPLNGSPDLPRVTYPAAFFDYRACDADIDADAQLNLDGGKTCNDQANWYDVGYGVPLDGQRLKRVW
jgi:hypothetical protein